MLNEDSRYDYVEVEHESAIRKIRARVRTHQAHALPVGRDMQRTVGTIPMQAYLRDRFPHLGGENLGARLLRLMNQVRHDLCAAHGNWPMSRTS